MQCYPLVDSREFCKAVICGALFFVSSNTFGQVSDFGPSPGSQVNRNLVKVSSAAAAPLQQGSLALVLDTGKANIGAQKHLYVTLIQPNGIRKTVKARPNSVVNFTGVAEGFLSLVVTADIQPNSLASPYAAMGFVARELSSMGPSTTAVRLPVAMLDVRQLANDLAQFDSLQASTSEILEETHFATVGRSQLRVQRAPDGSLAGKIISPQRGYVEFPGRTKILLYRDRVVVAQTTSQDDGTFLVERAPLGDISLLAVGAGGHSAFRVNIADSNLSQTTLTSPRQRPNGEFPKLVALGDSSQLVARRWQASEMEVLLVPTAMNNEVQQLIEQSDQEETPDEGPPAGVDAPPLAPGGGGFAGGGGVGGGSGGGGGLGSLGDLAGLAGAAGLAVGVAALADDDDGFNVNQATQITP